MFRVKVLSLICVTLGLALLTAITSEFSKSNAVTFPSTEKSSFPESSNPPNESERKLEERQQFTAQRQRRIALVIGNGTYPEDPLSNPVNDASDVAQALREIGFEVTLLKNAARRTMDEAVETFSRQLRQGDIGIFYYAGHGVQVAGENYLIPLDAKLSREKDVSYEAIPLGKVLNAIEDTEARVKIIILDACRDNPFYRRWRSTGRSLANRGLSGVSSAQGTLIAFSTAPGQVAADFSGEKSRNSPYTTHLLKFLKTPNLEIGQMFRRVREGVLKATGNEQIPWVSESLVGDVFLNPKESDVAVSSPSQPSTPTPKPQVTPPNPTPQSLPPQKPLIPEVALVSSKGMNYTRLRDLLAQGKWQEADEETSNLLLELGNKEAEWLDAKNLSCEDLKTIDRLWVAYSQGKFGFSVQKEIYQSLGGTEEYNEKVWNDFGDRVGWRVNNEWIAYDSLFIDDIARKPNGSLPTVSIEIGVWEIALRLVKCRI